MDVTTVVAMIIEAALLVGALAMVLSNVRRTRAQRRSEVYVPISRASSRRPRRR